MDDDDSNENIVSRVDVGAAEADAHGHAAMLLSESILHGLIARSLITVADAIEIVEVAAEVDEAIAADGGGFTENRQKSLAILDAIRSSLTNDLQDGDSDN